MDKISQETRSKNMAAIKGKNTLPEMAVRRMLFRRGYRYRLHPNKLPGHPDIFLPKYKLAIFVHGCFWHQHPDCKFAVFPSSNQEFWERKLRINRERDLKNIDALSEMGYTVLVLWECEIFPKRSKKVDEEVIMKRMEKYLNALAD